MFDTPAALLHKNRYELPIINDERGLRGVRLRNASSNASTPPLNRHRQLRRHHQQHEHEQRWLRRQGPPYGISSSGSTFGAVVSVQEYCTASVHLNDTVITPRTTQHLQRVNCPVTVLYYSSLLQPLVARQQHTRPLLVTNIPMVYISARDTSRAEYACCIL